MGVDCGLAHEGLHSVSIIRAERRGDVGTAQAAAERAVFPCRLKIIQNCIFCRKDPIVLGVEVVEGIARVGTPIAIPSQNFITIGKIASMEVRACPNPNPNPNPDLRVRL